MIYFIPIAFIPFDQIGGVGVPQHQQQQRQRDREKSFIGYFGGGGNAVRDSNEGPLAGANRSGTINRPGRIPNPNQVIPESGK